MPPRWARQVNPVFEQLRIACNPLHHLLNLWINDRVFRLLYIFDVFFTQSNNGIFDFQLHGSLPEAALPYLEPMGLATPETLMRKMDQRMIVAELRAGGHV